MELKEFIELLKKIPQDYKVKISWNGNYDSSEYVNLFGNNNANKNYKRYS